MERLSFVLGRATRKPVFLSRLGNAKRPFTFYRHDGPFAGGDSIERSSAARAATEQRPHAHVELAPHQAQHALQLGRLELEPLPQIGERTLENLLARPLDPARGRGAMHAVERAELVDIQPVDKLLAQE